MDFEPYDLEPQRQKSRSKLWPKIKVKSIRMCKSTTYCSWVCGQQKSLKAMPRKIFGWRRNNKKKCLQALNKWHNQIQGYKNMKLISLLKSHFFSYFSKWLVLFLLITREKLKPIKLIVWNCKILLCFSLSGAAKFNLSEVTYI